jgi:hypothetical protein
VVGGSPSKGPVMRSGWLQFLRICINTLLRLATLGPPRPLDILFISSYRGKK